MHLQRLKISSFRNLQDFEINFTAGAKDADGVDRAFTSHAVIGQNGSGKSNMIEAIVTIFRDLDLNQKTEFDYGLEYYCRGHFIRVSSKEGKAEVFDNNLVITLSAPKDHPLSHLSRNAKKYLPSHVFAYYSGRNERIESLFQTHQKRFYDALLEGKDELIRRLFYCRSVHSQFVMLAYEKDEDACIAVVAAGIGQPDRTRAEKTIEIMGLNLRPRLNEKRNEFWDKCMMKIAEFQQAPGPQALRLVRQSSAQSALKEMVAYNAEFSSVSEACIRKYAPVSLIAAIFENSQ